MNIYQYPIFNSIVGNRIILLNNEGYTTIKDAKIDYPNKSNLEIYEVLLKKYNKEAKKENERIVKDYYVKKSIMDLQKIENRVVETYSVSKRKELERKKKQTEKRKMKSIININQLELAVKNKLADKKGKFEIVIKSAIADISRTFKFNHLEHFKKWIDSLIETNEVDSNGNTNSSNTVLFRDRDLFENIKLVTVKIISGGTASVDRATDITLKSPLYNYKLHNPISKNNNCFFACLNHINKLEKSYHNLRKQFKLVSNTEITIEQAYTVIKELNMDIQIIDYQTDDDLDENIKYIVYKNSHFYVLTSFQKNKINNKPKQIHRGLLTFDFETRKTEEYNLVKRTGQKLFILKDTICCVYYRNYRNTDCENLTLITNDTKSSARQFIDWLNTQSNNGKKYNIIAHNGGRFDFYFFIASLTEEELLESQIQLRGTTIISISYKGHIFKDSYCFLTDSLKNLSKSFKIDDSKITSFNIRGLELTSEQLCFYRHELKFNEFLELQHSDKEFWDLYEKYCLYDCISLFQIWDKFNKCVNGLIEQINPYLLRKCPLMAASTIGSHSKKIIVELNKIQGRVAKEKQGIDYFTGVSYVKEGRKWITVHDMEKYNFLCKFKRGGISHCNQMGKHNGGITGVDIASQYPASLIYSRIPTGNSKFVEEYDESYHGFYLIKDCVFNSYKLKPVALAIKDQSLNWASNEMEELYVDSYMLRYLMENYGLTSFTVIKGLVSNFDIDSSEIFGRYINVFYNEKKNQDTYKSTGNPLYNEALRQTIKLYLNSLTGKLVEDPSRHFSLSFDTESNTKLCGKGVTKTYNDEKINDWIVCGIMVYSYSKRLLFEYIKCLPDNSNSVIHIETDGIYFNTKHLSEFTENLNNYSGTYPCKFGDDLGNLKIEKTTHNQVAYFLGKKFYCITMNDDYNDIPRDDKDKNIYRIKGFPQRTINPDGSNKYLVDVSLYKECYNGKDITRTFTTLKKTLYDANLTISSYDMTRTIVGNKTLFKEYD